MGAALFNSGCPMWQAGMNDSCHRNSIPWPLPAASLAQLCPCAIQSPPSAQQLCTLTGSGISKDRALLLFPLSIATSWTQEARKLVWEEGWEAPSYSGQSTGFSSNPSSPLIPLSSFVRQIGGWPGWPVRALLTTVRLSSWGDDKLRPWKRTELKKGQVDGHFLDGSWKPSFPPEEKAPGAVRWKEAALNSLTEACPILQWMAQESTCPLLSSEGVASFIIPQGPYHSS